MILITGISLILYALLKWVDLDNIDFLLKYVVFNSSSALYRPKFLRKSFVCDYEANTMEYPWIDNRSRSAKSLKTYCSKIANPIKDWKKATLHLSFSLLLLYIAHELRAYATHGRLEKHWQRLYQSNTKKIFHGLQLIYRKQQSLHASKRYIWYILVGCDTYINPPYFLKQLEPYDFMQPYFIGGSFAEELCYHKNKTTYRSQFIGGNSAHVFSTALVETLYSHLSPFVETVWPQPNHSSAAMSDIALSCLIISLGYKMTILSSFMRRSSKGIIEEFGLKNALRVREPSSWHYIHPLQMIDLDEFYAYHDVDRLMNDQKWMELVDFIRLLIGTHYETLRKHQPLDSHKLVRHYK
ncbi:unnamed protein product [Rotaria socialis]|uniref:Fringe-like glycosyltransferase domain-containing protein n=1 Tax=Rotaria socialis TaxID=392032 RepID=A0A820FND2_9BILA|nr:unnamed protein product [Rotaria socialis]CAF4265722.1 unnamed protein product [Rotaria socialis]CAF4485210.1 unnamed protein product [Rotaria socialis]